VIDRSVFSAGTKGSRGVCSARGCLRNATHVDTVPMRIVGTDVSPMHVARCDTHPARGVNRLTGVTAHYARSQT
jgi:hypothetical protein